MKERASQSGGHALARDLEGVEEQAGAGGVEFVSGEAEDDLAQGVLEFALVGRQSQVEGFSAAAGGWGRRAAVGMVVVAVELAAESRGAAVAGEVGVGVEDMGAYLYGCAHICISSERVGRCRGASPRVLLG